MECSPLLSGSSTAFSASWWGGYWGIASPPVPSQAEIYLYLDDGTGTSPTLPQHSSAIQSWMLEWGDYSEVEEGEGFRYEYQLPQWLLLEPGVHYWLEIRKKFPFSGYGQYGWRGSDPVLLATAVQGFDGIGVPWWTPFDPPSDLAFELVFDDTLGLEQYTWGNIKTLSR